VSITPVFGLTKSQLQPILDNIANEPVTSFDVSVKHQVQGFYGTRGEKVIPTFTYTTQTGRTGNTTVFVKRQYANYPGHSEAHHYVYLGQHQAPVPRMYGALIDSDQREILFLEYLDEITNEDQFLNDDDKFRQFLSVMARFNAIQPSQEYVVRLHKDMAQRPGPPGLSLVQRMTAAVSALSDILAHARKGELGNALEKLCSDNEGKFSRLQMHAKRLIKLVAQMETGLCHNDFHPYQTAWRQKTGELLMFDLEYVGLGVRFYDITPWLGELDDMQPQLSRDELAQYYLEQYVHWHGCPVSMAQFLEETCIIRMAFEVWKLIWWRERRPLRGGSEEECRKNRDRLHRQLSTLLHQVSREEDPSCISRGTARRPEHSPLQCLAKMEDKQQVKLITQYLSWALSVRADVQDISPLRSPLYGGNHENWRVRALLDNEALDFVVRVMPFSEHLGFSREVLPYNLEIEFSALNDLEKTALLTPKVWGLDMEGRFLGRPAFVMEYIEGTSVLEAVKSEPEVVLQSFAEAILAMNRISPAQVPSVVAHYGEPGDEPADLVGWLKVQAENISVPPFFRRGLEVLEKESPRNRPKKAFGNGDLGPQNFIYTSERSVAIVDWEYVGFSDPIAEITLLHVWPKDEPFLRKYPLDKLYCRLAGLETEMLSWYELYSALAGWIFTAMDGDEEWMTLHEHLALALLS